MQIKTKYNIGDHIIVTYQDKKEVCLYDDYIKEITVTQDQECTPLGNTMKTKVLYYGDVCPDEIEEKDIILYDDEKTLVKQIKEVFENEKNNI